MTALLRAIRGARALALPFIARNRIAALRRDGVPAFRAHEVLGHATGMRPGGRVIWLDVGPARPAGAVLRLIHGLEGFVLITTRDAASARAFDGFLPAQAQHQFAPLDAPGPLTRFLKRWRPDVLVSYHASLRREVPLPAIGLIGPGDLYGWRSAPRSRDALFRRYAALVSEDADHCDHVQTAPPGEGDARLLETLHAVLRARDAAPSSFPRH